MRDKLQTVGVALFTVLAIYIVTRNFFLTFAAEYKLLGGFVKFFVLASIGDFISIRLKSGTWILPKNMFFKAVVWGFIGMVIVIIFGIFSGGVASLQAVGVLPFEGGLIATAFFISFFMNLTFAPTMMAFHRMTDTYLDMKYDKEDITFVGTIGVIDWSRFFKLVIVRTIPLFWIPAHTITFMLGKEYQVIFAAVLGIFLGLLLGLLGGKK